MGTSADVSIGGHRVREYRMSEVVSVNQDDQAEEMTAMRVRSWSR